jgi:hypothetical protein
MAVKLYFPAGSVQIEPGESLGGRFYLETAQWYAMVLDADQQPTFQLTLVGPDTTMLTEKYRFFDNAFFLGDDYLILTVKDWDGTVETENRLCLSKGWFFGHFIRLYYKGWSYEGF